MGEDVVKRVEKYLEFWTGGMDSLLYPSNVAESQYHWGENILNRGGIPQTRPGLALKLSIPGNHLQGFTTFTPTKGMPYLVIAVDGKIYISPMPFSTYTQLPNIQFLPDAEFVVFEKCVKSVKRNPNGTLTLITPRRTLVMQDGFSRAAFWDGIDGKHVNPEPPDFGTPTGLWMSWTAGRLWIITGSQVKVGDYADPLSFSENEYLAERSNFELPDLGTGMIEVPDRSGLLVFTRKTTTLFKSSIRQRTLWAQTPNFQDVIIPQTGCVAGKSPINHFGVTYWYSEAGLTNLDSALFSQRTSQLAVEDSEMMRGKRIVSPTDHRACTGTFDNILFLSVPAGSLYNSQTWVLDQSVADKKTSDSPPAWAGVWTGFRPAQWAALDTFGKNRLFFGAYDQTKFEDTRIHIWEAITDNRLDRGNRITCQFETRAMLPSARLVQFRYAELDLVELIGTVRLKVYYAGLKGGYELVLDTVLEAEEGSVGGIRQETITLSTVLQGYKPQTRTVKTKDVTSQDKSTNVTGCSAESSRPVNVDKAFSILVEWVGRMGIRGIRVNFDTVTEQESGACSESETGKINIVTERGQTL